MSLCEGDYSFQKTVSDSQREVVMERPSVVGFSVVTFYLLICLFIRSFKQCPGVWVLGAVTYDGAQD